MTAPAVAVDVLAYIKTNTSAMLDVQETVVCRTKSVGILRSGNQRAVPCLQAKGVNRNDALCVLL